MLDIRTACDTGPVDSFLSLLQHNVLDHKRSTGRAELIYTIMICVVRTHHRRGRQRDHRKLTRITDETLAQDGATVEA